MDNYLIMDYTLFPVKKVHDNMTKSRHFKHLLFGNGIFLQFCGMFTHTAWGLLLTQCLHAYTDFRPLSDNSLRKTDKKKEDISLVTSFVSRLFLPCPPAPGGCTHTPAPLVQHTLHKACITATQHSKPNHPTCLSNKLPGNSHSCFNSSLMAYAIGNRICTFTTSTA